MKRSEIKAKAERVLGWEITPAIWKFLIREGNVKEVETGYYDNAFDNLLKKARELREVQQEEKPPRPRRPRVDTGRRESARAALASCILARRAAERADVRAFRSQYLPEGLLPIEGIGAWVDGIAAQEGEPTATVTVEMQVAAPAPLAPDFSPEGLLQWIAAHAPVKIVSIGEGILTLSWLNEQRALRTQLIAAGGVLDTLRKLAQEVAEFTGWKPEEAVAFILTDVISMLPDIAWAVHFPAWPYSGIGRMVAHLEVDMNTSPKELADTYQKLRRRYLPGRRHRPMGERVKTLVSFAGAFYYRADKKSRSWGGVLKLWNERYPKWAYKDTNNLTKDYHRAVKTLFPNAYPREEG